MRRNSYFSQRMMAAEGKTEPDIAGFGTAFHGLTDQYIRQGYFAESFGKGNERTGKIGLDPNLLNEEVRICLGWSTYYWAFSGSDLSAMMDLAELLYDHVSKPTGFVRPPTGELWFSVFDAASAKREFEGEFNGLAARFGVQYRFRDGEIRISESLPLDEYVFSLDFKTDDPHLNDLLSRALDAFYDRASNRKHDGLCSLVDAYERLKSVFLPDKKQSVEAMLRSIAKNKALEGKLNNLMQALTDIGNQATIRHHEVDKVVIDDDEIVTFLFYSYYNVVRLMLNTAIDEGVVQQVEPKTQETGTEWARRSRVCLSRRTIGQFRDCGELRL